MTAYCREQRQTRRSPATMPLASSSPNSVRVDNLSLLSAPSEEESLVGRTPGTSKASGAISTPFGADEVNSARHGREGARFTSQSKYRDEKSRGKRLTARQAAIAAKQQLLEKKQREASLLKRQQEQMMSAAKVKNAETFAERKRSLQERERTGQRQRRAAAAAKIERRLQQAEALSRELQQKMSEQREVRETLKDQERRKRRQSLERRKEGWREERQQRSRKLEALKEERRVLMNDTNLFRQAKNKVREAAELGEKFERIWRARQGFLHKRLDLGMGDLKAFEAWQLRRDRAIDQAALDAAAEEEKRRRRTSAQWRRNKLHLERELERGMGDNLDPLKLADELYHREEGRKEEREYREMQEALRRQSRERRRLSEARRAELTATMRKRDRELENDLQASAEAGAKDVEAYREACLLRERESLDGHRRALMEGKALESVAEKYRTELETEERMLQELVREDILAHKDELEAMEKAEEEFRRREIIRDREMRLESAKKCREEEEKDRSYLKLRVTEAAISRRDTSRGSLNPPRMKLEDMKSVSASKKKEEDAERMRLEQLRELPSEITKLEILEAMWARQTHPAAAAAARGRRRFGLGTVKEERANGKGESELSALDTSSSSSSSSSSGMGIKGRFSPSISPNSPIFCASRRFKDDDDDLNANSGARSVREDIDGVNSGRHGGELDASCMSLADSGIKVLTNVRLAEDDVGERGCTPCGDVAGWSVGTPGSASADKTGPVDDGVRDTPTSDRAPTSALVNPDYPDPSPAGEPDIHGTLWDSAEGLEQEMESQKMDRERDGEKDADVEERDIAVGEGGLNESSEFYPSHAEGESSSIPHELVIDCTMAADIPVPARVWEKVGAVELQASSTSHVMQEREPQMHANENDVIQGENRSVVRVLTFSPTTFPETDGDSITTNDKSTLGRTPDQATTVGAESVVLTGTEDTQEDSNEKTPSEADGESYVRDEFKRESRLHAEDSASSFVVVSDDEIEDQEKDGHIGEQSGVNAKMVISCAQDSFGEVREIIDTEQLLLAPLDGSGCKNAPSKWSGVHSDDELDEV